MVEEHFVILGGNGFIGFETVMAIVNKYSETAEDLATAKRTVKRRCCVTLLNRGKSWDWDKWDALNQTSCTFCSVKHVRYSRKQSPEECVELVKLMSSIDKIAAVIDFSAYRPLELRRFVEFVCGKCQLYVLISTDSVYDVCLEKCHSGRVLETDAVRPSLESDSYKYSCRDKYGHQKLCCEEYLHQQSLCPGRIPYLVFRLADVIGPRDSTNRFWQYLLWLKLCLHHEIPFYFREVDRNKLISLCYVKDVATLLAHCSHYYALHSHLLTADCCCYNLAADESITVKDVIKLMCNELAPNKEVKICYTTSQNVPQILPSVSCGPISAAKANTVLGWSPTSLSNAIKDTVHFYLNIMESRNFSVEKEECMTELLDDLADVYPEHVFEFFQTSLTLFLKL